MSQLILGAAVDAATHSRREGSLGVDSADLTTHGVIVGMTGSGKTGLAVVLLEETLASGVPVIAIDPKGDLTNLLLTFPKLDGPSFRPWVDEGEASRQGLTTDAFAEQQATTWREGLAGWGIDGNRVSTYAAGVEFTIYTPGSTAGVPLNLVGSLEVPATDDLEVRRDEVEGFVSGLLGLVGIDADPLASREHILLSNLIETSWMAGRSLDLPTLVGQVQSPPIRKLGVFDLDTFYPPADRTALALRLNGLLASPSFTAWSAGSPLDIDGILHAPDGRPACAVVSIAHLSDEERQFVVALVLAKVVTWMRRQSGTTGLRALVYMDEVAGYLPPSANPPTKKPIMMLMKQARAFGVGVVLATQNPVDVDYKALSNAGTWMVGRLQTERDKARLLDGMSAASGGVDVQAVGDTISGLAKREFVLRRAGRDQPEVMTSRWAMSYLRGPLTRDQIATVTAASPRKSPPTPATGTTGPVPPQPPVPGARSTPQRGPESWAPPTGAPTAPPATAAATTALAATTLAPADLGDDESLVAPKVASGIPVRFLNPAAPWAAAIGAVASGRRHEPAAVARVRLRYDDDPAGIRHDDEYEAILFPLSAMPDPAAALPVDYDDRDLVAEAPAGVVYALGEADLGMKSWWTTVQRDLIAELVRNRTISVKANRELKLFARIGESDVDFAARCDEAADAQADKAAAALRTKYEAKVKRAAAAVDTAEGRVELLSVQAKSSSSQEVLSVAGSLLGSFLGGRSSARSMSRTMASSAGSIAGRRGRTAAAGERLETAEEKVTTLRQAVADIESELAADLADITSTWDAKGAAIDDLVIPLERTDVDVAELVLVWIPVA